MNNTETRLELYDGSQWYSIPMAQDIPISINLSIADVREPDKVKASGSKTVSIPFSKEANRFFEFIFQANIDLQTFDPNLKTPAKYYIGERKVFEGDLQLIKINVRTHGTVTDGTYECNIVGQEGGIFIDMGDVKLEDLDYSDLDHAFTITADDKFTPAVVGTGYAYGFVDYGFGDVSNQVWKFTDLKCGIFEREYLRRIFDYFGYTWTSSFLDSAFYKRLWIPDVNEGRMKQQQSLVDNAQFYAGLSTYQTAWSTMGGLFSPVSFWNGNSVVQGGYYQYGTPLAGIDPLFQGVYDDETTTPFFDNGGVYNNVSMIFTTNLTSNYQVAAYNKFRLYIDTSAMSITFGGSPVAITDFTGTCQVEIWVNIEQFINGNWNSLLAQQVTTVNITNLGNYDAEVFVSTPTLLIPSGRLIRSYVYARAVSTLQFYNYGISPSIPINPNGFPYVVSGVPTLVFDAFNGNYFYGKIMDASVQYGQTVEVGQTVPRDIKCKDFFKSIIQRFNLRVEPQEDNPKNLIIEPYADFYTTSAGLDWTEKIDVNSPMEWRPMGELQGRTYVFSYKEDKDVYNEDYQDKFKEAYGTEKIDINNEFIRGEKKNELIFSNTPIVGNIYNTLAVPKLYKVASNGQAQTLKCNIRSLYWGGLISCTPYTFDVNGTQTTRTTYPYVGFVNSPSSPTLDLSFDNPFKLYWALPAQTFTNNNLYNIYWKQFIDEITDKNSKILTAKFRLNPQDIKGFSFRNVIFIIDAYYIVNKIMDYNPLEVGTCTVELLKLQNVELFTPDNQINVGPGGGTGNFGGGGSIGLNDLPGGGFNPGGNGGGGVVLTGNYDISSEGNIIIGTGNFIA